MCILFVRWLISDGFVRQSKRALYGIRGCMNDKRTLCLPYTYTLIKDTSLIVGIKYCGSEKHEKDLYHVLVHLYVPDTGQCHTRLISSNLCEAPNHWLTTMPSSSKSKSSPPLSGASLKFNFGEISTVTSALPLFSFVYCVLYTFLYNFEASTGGSRKAYALSNCPYSNHYSSHTNHTWDKPLFGWKTHTP